MLTRLARRTKCCVYNTLFRRAFHLSLARARQGVTMNWSANVLSTVTSDTEPTIVIEFDSAKYIFNAGENINRVFIQGRPNWRKTKGIFLTSVGAHRASGLAGMLMTLADGNIGQVDVIGPQGLTHFLAAMRKYVQRDNVSVNPKEVPLLGPSHMSSSASNPVYKDECVTIYALPLLPDTLGSLSADGLEKLHEASATPVKRKRSSSVEPPSATSKRPSPLNERLNPELHASRDWDDHNISVETLSRAPGFNPQELQGQLAQRWRELIVSKMFVQSKPTANQKMDQEAQHASGRAVGGKGNMSSTSRKHANAKETTPAPVAGSSSEQGFGSSPLHKHIPRARGTYVNGWNDQLPLFSLVRNAPCNTVETKPTLVYAIVGPRIRGKFDAKKAKALQIPNGDQRRSLTQGQTITFKVKEDGQMVERTVRPEEVIGASEAPSVALILDTPTRGHITPLITSFEESPTFARFLSRAEKDIDECSVRAVFHICGDDVLEDERYISFMNRFGPDVQHVISSRQHGPNPVSFTSAAFNQLRLSQLDANIFRIPTYSLNVARSHEMIPNIPANSSMMCANARHSIRPFHPPAYDKLMEEKDLFHPAAEVHEPLALSDLTTKRFREAKDAVVQYSLCNSIPETPGSNVVVTPLGTSSAVPTKYRNVSSTLVRIPNYGSILLDTGEGTWGQFARHFGTSESMSPNVWDALRELKCIFISHIHADHHVGLAKILAMRSRLDPPPTEPLYLIAQSAVFLYIHEYADIEELGLNRSSENGVKCILSDTLHVNTSQPIRNYGDAYHWLDVPESHRLVGELCKTLGLQSFCTVDVHHTAACYAALIKHMEGWSIVFSGDTIPTDKLVRAGKGATLLIHEASMGDDPVETAIAQFKRHSTFGQAVDIGRRMKADNILLTHFSARYPQMPPSGVPQPHKRADSSREPFLALAFDNADIKIGDVWKMNMYLQAIEQSFLDTAEEGDDEQNTDVQVDVPL